MHALSFLESVAGYTVATTADQSANRPILLGTVDAAYAGPPVLPRITFDGESTLSGKTYPFVATYTPVPGDRVALVPVGTTYLIIGPVAATSAAVAVRGGSLDITGNATVGGTLAVTGAATIGGTATLNGAVNTPSATGVNVLVAGVSETWHNMTLTAPFTPRGGAFPPPRYRRLASPPNSIQIDGQAAMGGAASGSTIAVLPVGYRPVTYTAAATIVAGGTTAGLAFDAELDTAGNLRMWGAGGSGFLGLQGILVLD